MTISGKHGGKSVVEFDWLEEGGCIECQVEAYDDEGFLIWHCEYCGDGKAKLLKIEQ